MSSGGTARVGRSTRRPTVTALSLLYGVACISGDRCFATGFAGTALNPISLKPLIEQTEEPAASGQGFDAAGADGGVFAFGTARFFGSMGGLRLDAPIVGMAPTPDGDGYWLVAADGGVFAFGDARFFGSMGGDHLDAPVVGMAPTPDGGGYWLVAVGRRHLRLRGRRLLRLDGRRHLDAPDRGHGRNPGRWRLLVGGADGGVFAFGDAGFFGSMGGPSSATGTVPWPRIRMGAATGWSAADGGVFAFGDAGFGARCRGRAARSSAPGPEHREPRPTAGATGWSRPTERLRLRRRNWLGDTGSTAATPLSRCGPRVARSQPGRRWARPAQLRRLSRRPPSPGCARRRPSPARSRGPGRPWRPRSGGRRPRRAGGGRPPRCWRCRWPRWGGPWTRARRTR